MHIVAEDQKRPKKGRTGMERLFRRINDATMVLQLVCWLFYTSTVARRGVKTFAYDMWGTGTTFQLSEVLEYKLANCSYHTVTDLYAFTELNLTLTRDNTNEMWIDFAAHVRLLVVATAVLMVVASVNKFMFLQNMFHYRFHHLYLHKEIVTATEFILIGYQLFLLVTLEPQKSLFMLYLRHCNVRQTNYLPFVSSTSLWVFFAVTVAVHFFSVCCFMWNALPKLGLVEDDVDPSNPPVWRVLQSILDQDATHKADDKRAKRQDAVQLGNAMRSDHGSASSGMLRAGSLQSGAVDPQLLMRMPSPQNGRGRHGSPRSPRKDGGRNGPPPPPPTFFDR